MHMYMCMCRCVYTYIYIYVYICVYTYVCMPIHRYGNSLVFSGFVARKFGRLERQSLRALSTM